MWSQTLPWMTTNVLQELSSADECWREFSSLHRLLSHKEMMGMRVAMLASVHSSLQLVDLSWIFTIWIFLIKKIFLILFPRNIALRASFTLSAWNTKKALGHGCFPLWMTLNHVTSVMAGDLKFSANCFNKNARPYWQNLTGWCNHSL